MPVQHTRDDAYRRIRLTLTGAVTIGDLIDFVEYQIATDAWLYGLLVDARLVSTAPGATEILSLTSRVRGLVAEHGRRGPIAVVIRDGPAVAATYIYQFFGGDMEEQLKVFWDVTKAQQWLDDCSAERCDGSVR